ncbi:serine O-acetyltransferase [Pelomonas sp. P7]|uniref:serine O-acetyltransferase n=1 Tax=Pelomonas caseinilytica TaxID=2906763 RepID=A0ABS8XJ88_9BURK|nr:serine O-acetyltransferase EpsC [Pelomonas sp. P7]MCE4538634.1 serine O-acetyltransferase [Pelomonas sp. P7]
MTDQAAPPPNDTATELQRVVDALRGARQRWRDAHRRGDGRDLPSRELLAEMVQGLSGALFPMRLGPPTLQADSEDYYVGHTLGAALATLREQAAMELRHDARQRGEAPPPAAEADALARRFLATLPSLRELLDRDVLAAYRGDPAARSVDEVLICYPGVRALISHRIAHELYRLGLPLIARVVAELAHAETGIDIHPGATIGPGCFIDHGTGVVIGETAVLGRGVRIYQNVTLGAKSIPTDGEGQAVKGEPRHPIVEDEVVIYAGATVLGRVTIGRGAVIGGNVWLTRSVAPGSVVTQADTQSGAA